MSIQKVGKKTQEWIKIKPKLVKEYLEKGIIKCENDGRKFGLSFHHRPKRSSQEAKHDFKHTRLLCQECHDFFESNEEMDKMLFAKARGYNPKLKIDIMKGKEKSKSKKPEWQQSHQCINCKQITSMLICEHCKEISVKQYES